MSETIIYVADGKVTNRVALKQAFTLADGRYLVTIKGFKKRSLPQNKYWWGCLVPLVREGLYAAGYDEVKTNEDAHEVLKHLFVRKDITNNETGEVIATIGGSTTELTTSEFSILVDAVVKWAAEFLNVQIPLPNEPMVMFFQQ